MTSSMPTVQRSASCTGGGASGSIDVGQWWYQDHEIDVVGLTDAETLVVGECKYRSVRTDHDALRSLESHADSLRWTPPSGGPRRVEYALFSRAGFTESLRTAAEERDDLRLFELDEVVDALRE
jgi:hypothetical protein